MVYFLDHEENQHSSQVFPDLPGKEEKRSTIPGVYHAHSSLSASQPEADTPTTAAPHCIFSFLTVTSFQLGPEYPGASLCAIPTCSQPA
jgi:hypothetical protein